MKKVTSLFMITTFLFLLSTMICGLWMKSATSVTSGNLSFHLICGILSIISLFITMILFFFQNRQKRGA
ncbi:hypothetical protein [Breznakia pachnodae]|uniref:Uncharacterized BrkB/YihY/UPF0761 family membrane protein n=1 Tax=Breznakia pachnodae TaxID=265178 RepID=A0ABU0E4Z9_9FIRM|nr:hypothetical protein [Breznakia pachnodae]MDQ0361983.1 uncharacterized BrkB/YihY/UPF0761 family membrane protein [Breznakia pachnodae]